MSLVTDLQGVASDLITEFGQAATITRVVEGAYIPSTGLTDTATTTTYTAFLVPEGLTKEFDKVDQSTTTINAILYSATAPLIGDVVATAAVSYRIMSVVPVKLSGSVIIYNLMLTI